MRPVLFIFAFFLCAATMANAATQPTGPLTLTYGVYAGGFHALEATLKLDRNPTDYIMTLDATPFGVIGNLLPWGGNYAVHGTITGVSGDAVLAPQVFNKTSKWRDDNDSASFMYDNGKLISQTETDETKKPTTTENIPVTPELAVGAVDILTGTAQLLQQLDAGKPCNYSTIIYDGKRRYKLQFTDKGSETLEASDYNTFAGPAKICEIEMVPLAGFNGKVKGYYKIQEDARKRGQLPRVWMGHSYGYAGQDGPYIPVKMMVKSEYGAVLIHLQKAVR
jgi:hypothetical protein